MVMAATVAAKVAGAEAEAGQTGGTDPALLSGVASVIFYFYLVSR